MDPKTAPAIHLGSEPDALARMENPIADTRVLVVDDNVVNRQVVVRILEQLGCQVDVVENGALAVAATRDARYGLVLMDCLMPVMDGWKAAQAIRKIPGPNQQSRIVAMTACGLQEDKRRCMDCGMDDFMLKPLTLGEVARQIEKTRAKIRLQKNGS